jgi:RHS repeat-associated protein
LQPINLVDQLLGTTTGRCIEAQEIFDSRDRVVERRLFSGRDLSGGFDKTLYAYDPDGQLTGITDPAGNLWTYEYNLLGQQTAATDPDKGRTQMSYDNAGNVLTSTDARGAVVAYKYDILDRKTEQWQGAVDTGTKLADWVYDTLAKGQPTSSTRHDGGNDYTTAVTGYDDGYRSLGTSVTIPAAETGLAGTYISSNTYNVDGSEATATLPAAGGLPGETVTTTYTDTGFKNTVVGLSTYQSAASYDYDGALLQQVLGSGTNRVTLTTTLDPATRLITKNEVYTEHPGAPNTWDEQLTEAYTNDGGGNITAINETQAGATVANQCFVFDAMHRLTEGWTTTGACQATPTQADVGGVQSYWHSYTYNTVGLRTTTTEHSAAGDTVRTYHYNTVQPHTIASIDSTGPDGTSTYGYDPTGNTTTRPGPTGAQTLTWNIEGDLTKVTEDGEDTTFGYDADGNRLLRRDPDGTTTAYLGNLELRRDGGTGTVAATRYYGTTAVRTTTGGLEWLGDDHHGTGQITIDAATLQPTRRRLDPFGLDRGAPVAWPGDKGFVNGTQDPTGLTHLGAREYDPGLGRFVSVDPVFDTDDPQSMTGYSYCSADPINCVDRDGRFGWKKFFSKVATVTSYASMIPGPIGTIAAGVSAVSYAAAGDWKNAAIMTAGMALAAVGAGAVVVAAKAVRGARAAIGAVKIATKASKIASKAAKVASRAGKAIAKGAKGATCV